jgi:hypothetical protein
MDRDHTLILSRILLASKGYDVDEPDEERPLRGDVMAIDPASATAYLVYVTTTTESFGLWVKLLGDEVIRNLVASTGPPQITCLIHIWSMRADGRPMCEVAQVRESDFRRTTDREGCYERFRRQWRTPR